MNPPFTNGQKVVCVRYLNTVFSPNEFYTVSHCELIKGYWYLKVAEVRGDFMWDATRFQAVEAPCTSN